MKLSSCMYLPSVSLIEEFMLLANMAVAHRIYGAFPKLALLRRHPSPKEKPADQLVSCVYREGRECAMGKGDMHTFVHMQRPEQPDSLCAHA